MLQHALTELFEQREGSSQTSAAYEAIRGVSGTLARRVEEIYSDDVFGRHRLLAFDHGTATRAPTVELAHEALLREWGRLREWLDEYRAAVRIQRALATAAVEWIGADRDSSFLLRGTRLAGSEGWAAESDMTLTRDEPTIWKPASPIGGAGTLPN